MKILAFVAIILAAEPTWETFTSKAGKYSILLPEKPTEKTAKIGRATIHSIDVPLDGDSRFKLECFDTNANEEQMRQEGYRDRWLKNARNQMVKETRGKLVKETNVDVNGFPGRELEIELDKGVLRARIFLIKSWSYTLTLQSRDAKTLKSTEADKIFQSFKVEK